MGLFKLAVGCAIEGAAAGAAAGWANRKAAPKVPMIERPLRSYEVNGHTLQPMSETEHGETNYSLYVISVDGHLVENVQWVETYPELLAVIKRWKAWLAKDDGNTLEAWINEAPTEQLAMD